MWFAPKKWGVEVLCFFGFETTTTKIYGVAIVKKKRNFGSFWPPKPKTTENNKKKPQKRWVAVLLLHCGWLSNGWGLALAFQVTHRFNCLGTPRFPLISLAKRNPRAAASGIPSGSRIFNRTTIQKHPHEILLAVLSTQLPPRGNAAPQKPSKSSSSHRWEALKPEVAGDGLVAP